MDQHKEPRMQQKNRSTLLAVLLLLAASPAMAGTIEAINHTHWAVNHFSVNGQSGIDTIGPYQGGGGGCCYVAPPTWQPGMTVRIDWETGEGGSKGFPGFADRVKYLAWKKNEGTRPSTQQGGGGA